MDVLITKLLGKKRRNGHINDVNLNGCSDSFVGECQHIHGATELGDPRSERESTADPKLAQTAGAVQAEQTDAEGQPFPDRATCHAQRHVLRQGTDAVRQPATLQLQTALDEGMLTWTTLRFRGKASDSRLTLFTLQTGFEPVNAH